MFNKKYIFKWLVFQTIDRGPGDGLLFTKVNYHQTTIWEKMVFYYLPSILNKPIPSMYGISTYI